MQQKKCPRKISALKPGGIRMSFEDEMEKTSKKAQSLGIQGDDSDSQDGKQSESSEMPATSEETETSESLESPTTSETSETSGASSEKTEGESSPDGTALRLGGLEGEYPNPDKNEGSITSLYENINIYVPPEVKKETHLLFKQIEHEFLAENDVEIDKHWDFYAALFRTALRNEDELREELGIERTDQ